MPSVETNPEWRQHQGYWRFGLPWSVYATVGWLTLKAEGGRMKPVYWVSFTNNMEAYTEFDSLEKAKAQVEAVWALEQ